MATGAMSYAFVKALTENPKQNYIELLTAVRKAMQEGGYTQKPQLSACHRECARVHAAGVDAEPAWTQAGVSWPLRRRADSSHRH